MAQINPGTYSCRTKASYLLPPQEAGGQYQLAVTLDVDIPNEAGGADVVEWTYYASFSDASYPTFIEKPLKELGWDPAQNAYAFDQLDAAEQSPIAGKEAQAVFQMDNYSGTPKLKLRFLNGPRRAFVPKERMQPEQAKRFAADMRAKLMTRGGQQGVRAPAKSAPRPATSSPSTRAAVGAPDEPQRFDEETVRRAKAAGAANFDDIPF